MSSSTDEQYSTRLPAAAVEVLIDAKALGDDSAYRGIGTYLRNLLTGLSASQALRVRALATARTALPAGIDRTRLLRAAPGRWRPLEHELLLPLDLMRASAQVFHSPALDPPARCGTPWVQTLHDVIPLVFEAGDLGAERRRWLRQALRYQRANTVISVSRHTADLAVSVLGLDPSRIEVIPHGVSPAFKPAPAGFQADRPYVLFVGEYSDRKGYPEAFSVIGELTRAGYPHRLHVAGRIVPWHRQALDQLAATAPTPGRIDLLGFVRDLVREYQQADLLIFTSRYEGFGFPVLEAMASGTPVVAFSNSSITEVVGDAGILVGDGDIPAMVRAVRSVLDDPARREELRQRGLERAAQFSWERSAAEHAEIYKQVAAG